LTPDFFQKDEALNSIQMNQEREDLCVDRSPETQATPTLEMEAQEGDLTGLC